MHPHSLPDLTHRSSSTMEAATSVVMQVSPTIRQPTRSQVLQAHSLASAHRATRRSAVDLQSLVLQLSMVTSLLVMHQPIQLLSTVRQHLQVQLLPHPLQEMLRSVETSVSLVLRHSTAMSPSVTQLLTQSPLTVLPSSTTDLAVHSPSSPTEPATSSQVTTFQSRQGRTEQSQLQLQ